MDQQTTLADYISKEDKVQIDVFYSPPGEMGTKGCWAAWVIVKGELYLFNTYDNQEDTIENLLENIKKGLADGIQHERFVN